MEQEREERGRGNQYTLPEKLLATPMNACKTQNNCDCYS
jgi:hypothetical protein